MGEARYVWDKLGLCNTTDIVSSILPGVFSIFTSCSLIRIVKNASRTHAVASSIGIGDSVVLKTRYAVASTAASDSQTFLAAMLSAMWKTGRKYKSRSPTVKEIMTKLASSDW